MHIQEGRDKCSREIQNMGLHCLLPDLHVETLVIGTFRRSILHNQ